MVERRRGRRRRHPRWQREAPLELAIHLRMAVQAQEVIRVRIIIIIGLRSRPSEAVRIEQQLRLVGPPGKGAEEGQPVRPLDVVLVLRDHLPVRVRVQEHVRLVLGWQHPHSSTRVWEIRHRGEGPGPPVEQGRRWACRHCRLL